MIPLERIHPLLLAVLVTLCYNKALNCGLVYDDLAAIRDNNDVQSRTPLVDTFFNDFWGTPLNKEQSHKSYRPLTVLTFRLNYAVHGLDPFGYHLINVVLHAAVSILFHRLCLLFLPDVPSMVASALFAVHPIHTEAVTSVVGRAELLSAIGFLGALIFYINYKYRDKVFLQCGVTSFMAILGMLCKEQAITVLAVCCIYELATTAKNPSRLHRFRYLLLGRGIVSPWMKHVLLRVGLLISAAVFVLCARWKIMGAQLPVFSRFDNPAAVSSMPTRHLTYHYLLPVNAWLLLFPYYLCCDWSGSTVPLITCLWDVRNIATLIFYAVLLWCLKIAISTKQNCIPLVMSLSLLTVPFLPATNFLFPVGFVVAERVLYIPSMGFCMLIAQGWHILWERRLYKTIAAFGLLFLIVIHILKTSRRNADWQSEYHLFASALSINQRNEKLYNNMGKVLEGLNRHEEALLHYEEAIRLQPTDVRGYLNLGRILTSLRRYHMAEEVYLKAKKVLLTTEALMEKPYISSNHLQLYLNLALLISRNNSRLEEADELYRQAIMLRSDFSNAYLNRGDVLLKMNRTKEAEDMYYRALQIDDNNPDLYFNLGIVLMDQGRSMEALDFFNKALDVNPDHEESLVLSSILIRESGMSTYNSIAKSRLEKIVHQGKESERVYINLGLMSLENKDFSTAEMWFKKALHIKPNSRVAIFNLALLWSEHQHEKSLALLTKLLQYYPSHVNGLILMADVYVNHYKNLDGAEECYLKVLEVDPQNPKALHNLCVLYVERQNLQQAEQCFVHATSVHPTFDYIQKHLEITRSLLKQREVELSSTQLHSSHPSLLETLSTSSNIS